MKKIFKICSLSLGLSFSSLWAQSFVASKDAVMLAHTENFPSSYEKICASPWGQFCASKEMSEFWKPLLAWWAENTEKVQQELKLPQAPQITDVFKGEILWSLDKLDIDFDLHEGDFYWYALVETGKNNKVTQAIVDSMLKSMTEKDKKHERKDVRFMNHLFHTFNFQEMANKGEIKFSKELQLRFGQIDHVFYFGMGTVASQEKKLTEIVSNLGKSKPAGNDADIVLNMNPINKLMIEGVKMGQQKIKTDPPQGGPAMFLQGMDWVKMVSALGLLDLKSLSFSTGENPKFEKLVLNLDFLREPRGFLKMFLPDASMNLGEVPAWMPEDVVTYEAATMPLSQWYNILVTFVQQELPMFAPMVLGQMESLKQNFGVDIEKDIFGLFDDKIYQVILNSKNTKDIESMDEKIFIVKLKNGALLEQNLLKVLKMNPTLSLDAVPYMGGRCYEFPANPMTKLSPMLAFYNEYLIYSNQASDVRSVILNMGKPAQKSLLLSRELKSYRSVLPETYQGLSYQNTNLLIRKLLDMFAKNSETINAAMEGKAIEFDFSKLPKPEDLHIDFGTTLTVTKVQGQSIGIEIFQPKIVLKK